MYTKYTEPRFTEEERECWKILFVTRSGFHYTPCRLERVVNGQLRGEIPLLGLGKTELVYGHGILRVGEGFVHAFTFKPSKETMRAWNACAKSIKHNQKCYHLSAVAVKCRIPKGIRYYEDGKGEIAARMMYIVPDVPETKSERMERLLKEAFK